MAPTPPVTPSTSWWRTMWFPLGVAVAFLVLNALLSLVYSWLFRIGLHVVWPLWILRMLVGFGIYFLANRTRAVPADGKIMAYSTTLAFCSAAAVQAAGRAGLFYNQYFAPAPAVDPQSTLPRVVSANLSVVYLITFLVGLVLYAGMRNRWFARHARIFTLVIVASIVFFIAQAILGRA